MNKVSIYGGLGNQMFQYAFCTALNEKGAKARVSFSNFLYYHHHNGFDLSRSFKLKLPLHLTALNFFLLRAGFVYRNRIAAGFFRRLIYFYDTKRKAVYREKKEFQFDPDVFKQTNAFFIGTWQAPSYFKGIEAIVKKNFVFNIPTDETNETLINAINNCTAVSIHIRRGDYLNAHWNKSLGIIQGTTYYQNALAYINAKVLRPRYFIFSDDMNWVKENLMIPGCIYVDHNKGSNSFIDMYLMSLCKHNIIANSTFSWWAAWLNKNEEKIVIMPERWMNNNSCEELFPEEWIKMKI
jgi:hypothetical protein